MNQQMPAKILVVDDEELIRTTLSIKLSQDGYDVSTAESGKTALKALSTEFFDVVLCDLRMVGMDGIEVLKKVKKLYTDTEVIILTGYASLESAIEALRHDAYDYLLKPINDNKLRIVIKRCIEKKQLLKAIKSAEERIRYLNEFYESMLNHLDEAIFVVDRNLKLIDYNEVVTKWGREILGGRNKLSPGMDFRKLAPRLCKQDRVREYKQVATDRIPMHFEDAAGDPPTRWVLVRLLPMPDTNNEGGQVLTVITDITELKILEAESLRGKKLEGITQAAITLNHEINNPLGIILGNTNLIMTDSGETNTDLKEKLNIIYQQTLRISEITQRLAKITEPYEDHYLDDKMMIDVGRST